MNPLDLARKLRPLIPQEIDQLVNARATADAKLCRLIDQQLVLLGRKHLKSSALLLSLPPPERCQGTLHLGTVQYNQPQHSFSITRKDVTQHVAVFGRSGSGKTNLAFHLLLQLHAQGIPFVFLDWKRTARHLLPRIPGLQVYTPGRSLRPFPLNPFLSPPGLEPHLYIGMLLDILGNAFTLGDGSKSVLQNIFSTTKTPTVEAYLDQLESFPTRGRQASWKATALRCLQAIQYARLTPNTPIDQRSMLHTLTQSSAVIELDGLNSNVKAFLIPTLALWMYHTLLPQTRRETLKLVLIIEEAHHVLHKHPGKESILEMLLRQCRELGLGIVVIDQHPHLISSAALGNTSTTLFLNQKDPSDVHKAASIAGLTEQEKPALSRLSTGQAIVRLQERWHDPFLIHIPHITLDKGKVTDDMLCKHFPTGSRHSRQNQRITERARRVRDVRKYDLMSEEETCFVLDVLEHPWDGVKERYHRLGWSMHRGTKTKNYLVQHGMLEEQSIPIGRTRKTLLRTKLTSRTIKGRNESLEHAFWKYAYAERLERQGFSVEIEAPRHEGWVDVHAEKPRLRIAVEIETGKSNVISNVRKCQASKYDLTIVAVTRPSLAASIRDRLLASDKVHSAFLVIACSMKGQ